MTASRSSSRVGKVDVGSEVEKKDVGGRVVEPLAPVTASSSGIEMLAQAKLSMGRVDDSAELKVGEGNAMRSSDAIINRQKSARPTMKQRQMLAEQAQQANVRYLEGLSESSSTDSNADLGADLGTDSSTDSDYEELWNASGESSPNYAPPRPTGPKPSSAPGRPTAPKPSLAPGRPTAPKPSLAPGRPTAPKPSLGGAAAESAYEVPVPNSTYASSRAQDPVYAEIADPIYAEIADPVYEEVGPPRWDPSLYSTTAASGGNAAESAYEVPVPNSTYAASRAQDHVYEYDDPAHIYEDPDRWDPSLYSTTAASGGNAAESAYEVPVANPNYAASRAQDPIYEEIPDNTYEVPVVRDPKKKQKSKKPGLFDRMKNWFK